MKMFKKLKVLLFVTIALFMLAPMGVFADEVKEQTIEATIKGGGIQFEIPSVEDFGEIELDSQPKTLKAGFDGSFKIMDYRGTHDGYRVDVSATPVTVKTPAGGFKNGTSAFSLPEGSLSLAPISNVVSIGSAATAPRVMTNSNQIIDNGTVTILSAAKGTGMGHFEFSFSDALSLVVKNDTTFIDKVNYPNTGTPYESTVTWSLVTAP